MKKKIYGIKESLDMLKRHNDYLFKKDENRGTLPGCEDPGQYGAPKWFEQERKKFEEELYKREIAEIQRRSKDDLDGANFCFECAPFSRDILRSLDLGELKTMSVMLESNACAMQEKICSRCGKRYSLKGEIKERLRDVEGV